MSSPSNFDELFDFDGASADYTAHFDPNNQSVGAGPGSSSAAGGSIALASSPFSMNNGAAGQYPNGASSQFFQSPITNSGSPNISHDFNYQGGSSGFRTFAGPGGSSGFGQAPLSGSNAFTHQGESSGSQSFAGPGSSSGFVQTPSNVFTHQGESPRPQVFAGSPEAPSSGSDAFRLQGESSDSSSSVQVQSSSQNGDPNDEASSQPSSPTIEPQTLGPDAQRLFDSLPSSVQHSVGWHDQLDRMLTEHPGFIPTFDFDSMMRMNGRKQINKVSGDVPSAIAPDDTDLAALCDQYSIDPYTITCEQLAAMGDEVLDAIATHPKITHILESYGYEPNVGPETVATILPMMGDMLEKEPALLLAYYQTPLWKEDGSQIRADPEEADAMEEDEGEEDLEDDEPKQKGKPKVRVSERKYMPRKVQYAPYQYRFKNAEEARAYRKKTRVPAKIAHDIDRVEKYGRYYWTKRIYEAMINIDLIFDNKTSVIAANFSKVHHFKEADLEATAHHVFDACIDVHRRGWYGYTYNRRSYKRGKLKDIFVDTIEGRLERICGVLKHSKAFANDCVQGGDLLQQTVDNPIYRASTKVANNKGNLERARRLAKQETDRQREKRLAKEAEAEAKKIERARVKALKDAEKAAHKIEMDKQKAEGKTRKDAERAAAKAESDRQKAAEKARVNAEKAAEKARRDAEKATQKMANAAARSRR